jgi:hypothetical protein
MVPIKPPRERIVCFLLVLNSLGLTLAGQPPAPPRDVQVTVETDRPMIKFDPRSALGAGVDGHAQGDEMRMFSPENVRRMLQAGLGPISVRLRTELAVEAWHWNPRGQWSDPAHQQGYWVSDPQPRRDQPILLSYGYKLPRRGNTLDEANDDGYSMLDDGNPATFWKSNPYLSHTFSGEADSRHPGWVGLDFGKPVRLNAIRIHWADPYATRFDVEYAQSGRTYFGGHPKGVWTAFDHGKNLRGFSGEQFVKLSDVPVRARYLRIWMTEASGTAPSGSRDARDRLGYAIREIGAGWTDGAGAFHDEVVHQPGKRQTHAQVSSTDPWHRAADRDPKVEQPGIDLIFRSGITRGLPLMLAVPYLYDTPDNARSMAAYVKAAGYPIGRFELGEEPDGQKIAPADIGTLYAQVAWKVRTTIPDAVMGGPSFVTGYPSYEGMPYHEWLRVFRHELARRGQSGDLQFLSFEWYPFDDASGYEPDEVRENRDWLDDAIQRLGREHLPLVLSEYNYSAFFSEHEVDLGGALFNAETAVQFLCQGGQSVYYYGYEPVKLEVTNGSWGNQVMLVWNAEKGTVEPVATFHAMRMVTSDWLDPKGGVHQVFRVRTNLPKAEQGLVDVFAVERPDRSWSLLVFNKDEARGVRLSVGGSAPWAHNQGAATLVTYSAAQYRWQADGPNGHPVRNDPPAVRTVRVDQPVVIPPWSMSVLRAGGPGDGR